jgi:hypothetical protein
LRSKYTSSEINSDPKFTRDVENFCWEVTIDKIRRRLTDCKYWYQIIVMLMISWGIILGKMPEVNSFDGSQRFLIIWGSFAQRSLN